MSALLHGNGVEGCAAGAGDRQRGRRKQELVDPVGGAVGCDGLEVPYLAAWHTHVHQGDHVQRLEQLQLVGPPLEPPRVACHCCYLVFVEPRSAEQRHAGGVAAGVVAPSPAARAEQPGANHDAVSRADLHALCVGGAVELLWADREAWLQRLDALVAGGVVRPTPRHARSSPRCRPTADAETHLRNKPRPPLLPTLTHPSTAAGLPLSR